MALKIRLARSGAKKRPFYKIVVADSRSPRDGAFIEKLGFYNPFLERSDASRIVFDAERVKYWLSVGAQPSDRVELFLSDAGVLAKREKVAQTKKCMPKAKAQERMRELEEKRAASVSAE